jgi:nicotinamide mononucleotide (NMN) deamidase PncC
VANPVGTAPCFIVEKDKHYVFVLPGVPREMKFLTESRVLPWLREISGDSSIILIKNLRTVAVGESLIDEKIGDLEQESNPTVGLAAHAGQTDVRITAKGATRAEAEKLIADMETRVRERLGDWIYGVNTETVEEVIARMITAQQKTVALAESNTMGKIAERLRSTPEGLHISDNLIQVHENEVSDEHATAVAKALRASTGADIAIAVVSTMGNQDMYLADTGRTAVAIVTDGKTQSYTYPVGGMGEMAQQWTAVRALDILRRALLPSGL